MTPARRSALLVSLVLCGACAHAFAARADDASSRSRVVVSESFGDGRGETLAMPLLAQGDRPELIWAQRTIDREWMSTTDPDHPRSIAGWRSEPAAVALSAALPGAGQLYTGERSGYVFALAEAVGWITFAVLKND